MVDPYIIIKQGPGTHLTETLILLIFGNYCSNGNFHISFQYIGCLEVKESMRSLDFDTRTALARYVSCHFGGCFSPSHIKLNFPVSTLNHLP